MRHNARATDDRLQALLDQNLSRTDESLTCGADPNARYPTGCPGLSMAAACPIPGIVLLLLAAGADPDSVDEHGLTPAMHAIRTGWDANLRLLARARADLTLLHGKGGDAASLAIDHRGPDTLRQLLESGYPLDGRDALGRSLAAWAGMAARLDCLSLLAGLGADFIAKDAKWATPQTLARFNGHSEAAAFIRTAGLSQIESAALEACARRASKEPRTQRLRM